MAKRKRVSKAKTMPANVSAAPAPESSKSGGTKSRREQMREAAAARRRRQNILVYSGVALVVLIVVALVAVNVRNSGPVVGEESFAAQGNVHIPLGSLSPVEYNSTPPTSGPHYENLAGWGIHDQPVRYEHLIHNLEDGGVVVYYQCPTGCPEVVDQLRAIIEPMANRGMHVVLAPNDPTSVEATHKDMGAPIALTAWQKLLLMDEVDEETISTFIERYEGIDHHRG